MGALHTPYFGVDLRKCEILASRHARTENTVLPWLEWLCKTPTGRFLLWSEADQQGRLMDSSEVRILAYEWHATPAEYKQWFGTELPEA